jgi:hypothetical protein
VRHPEQRIGEIFLGNFDPNDLLHVRWKSVRTGDKSYCRDGSPYPYQEKYGVKPVFISCREVEQAIVSELADGDRFSRAQAYRQLLATRS